MLLYRILVISFLLISTSSCGFQPMYDNGDSGKKSLVSMPNIEVKNIPDRNGQFLRNAIIDQLYLDGRPSSSLYDLKLSPLVTKIHNIGIRKDASATRAQVQLSSTMQLIEKSSGKVVLERYLKTLGSYNLLDNQFAALVSKESTIDNILKDMANDVINELNLHFHSVNKNKRLFTR